MASVPTTKAATTGVATVPDFMGDDINTYAGVGNSTDSADSVVPYLAILQKGSPQVDEHNDAYVAGAKPGLLYNTATKDIHENVVVIPCGFAKNYIEWKPRSSGGGFVARHEFSPAVAQRLGASTDDKGKLVLPNGHELVETLYTFCLTADTMTPVVIAATSSAIKPMRQWMALRKAKRSPNGRELPSFCCQYTVGTVYMSNDKGTWFNYTVADAGFVTDAAAYAVAKAFAESTMAGETKMAEPDAPVDAPF